MAVHNREFPLICIRLDGYPRFPLPVFSSELSDRVRAEELSKSSKPQPQSQVKLVEVKPESFLDTGPHCIETNNTPGSRKPRLSSKVPAALPTLNPRGAALQRQGKAELQDIPMCG